MDEVPEKSQSGSEAIRYDGGPSGAVTLVPATANDHALGITGCDDVNVLEDAVSLPVKK